MLVDQMWVSFKNIGLFWCSSKPNLTWKQIHFVKRTRRCSLKKINDKVRPSCKPTLEWHQWTTFSQSNWKIRIRKRLLARFNLYRTFYQGKGNNQITRRTVKENSWRKRKGGIKTLKRRKIEKRTIRTEERRS